MNAEQLLSLANAHSINLSYVAAVASETDGVAQRRPQTAEERQEGREVTETASGRQTRSVRQAAWSSADVGHAAAAGKVGCASWLAIRYCITGDMSVAMELWQKLAQEACDISRRENWPPRVLNLDGQPVFYREQLVMLVLDEDAHRQHFATAPALYSAYMNVTQREWDGALESRFRSLKGKLNQWIQIGFANINKTLRAEQIT